MFECNIKDKECMLCETVQNLMKKFNTFDVADIGIFKVCIFTLGVLIGIYAHNTLKKFAPFIWITFIGTYVYILYRLLTAETEDDFEEYEDEDF